MPFTTLCGGLCGPDCIEQFTREFLQMPPISETRPDHNTGNFVPLTLCEKCVGSLTSPANQYREDAGDGTYDLSSLSEKTRTFNHLSSNPRTPARQCGARSIELTRLSAFIVFKLGIWLCKSFKGNRKIVALDEGNP